MAKWKQLFTYSRQERNGIAVLFLLMTGAFGYLALQPVLFQPASVPTEIPAGYFEQLNKPAKTEAVRLHMEKQQPEIAHMAGQRSLYQQNELFLFNPNGLDESEWIRLGLSPAQARSVKNFEAKGGTFRSKEDVRKLYVISPQKFNELEPYIVIPAKEFSAQRKDSITFVRKERTSVVLELNTADTSDLVKVYGIGPTFAKRIVDYRFWLGGFHHKEQLMEVYGIDAEKYTQIEASFHCDSSYITKINVNTALVSELKRHPYFTPTTANALVNYRKQHGNFGRVSDILQCKLITPELYEKISPYLTL